MGSGSFGSRFNYAQAREMSLHSLSQPARMSSQDTCISCGFGDDREHGHLVPVGGNWIHYYRCLNRNLPMPQDGERIEQATSAPGEVRDVHIPKKKQGRRPRPVGP